METYLKQLIDENTHSFYVFDTQILKERIAYLKKSLPDAVDLCYAVKANPFLSAEIVSDVERFEICSPGEGMICRKMDIPGEKMVISGVYKTPAFIENLVSDPEFHGIFTVESDTQYRLLAELAGKYRRTLPVLIRITNDSQFGVNEEEVKEYVKNREKISQLRILGIQYFSGTQKTSVKKLHREIEFLDGFLTELQTEYGFIADELEYGPGFPASYFQEEEFDEVTYLYEFSKMLSEMKNRVKVTLELGRSISYTCGNFYTFIVDKKQNHGLNYLLVDAGMHQLVYHGQFMGMKKPFVHVVGKSSEAADRLFQVCGSLCSMNDIIVKQMPLPECEIGDVLCFGNTGAYSVTEGIALFLSRDLPAVYIKRENESPVLVRKPLETMEWNKPM